MEYVLWLLVGTLVSWISLLIIVPIAQKLAEFSMPPWPETLWKLAVVAGAGSVIAILLEPVNAWLSWLVGVAVFFGLMYKWFDVGPFGAIIIVVVSWMLRILVLGALFAAFVA